MSAFAVFTSGRRVLLPGSLIAILLVGCGDPDVGKPQIVTSGAQPSPTPLPEPTATPEPVEMDFASLSDFPGVEFNHSWTLSTEETPQAPVMDLEEYSEDQVWWTVTPATFELTLPPGASVHRVEVEGAEGAAAFPECVVFLQGENETEWRRPFGLELEHRMGEFVEGKGYRLRHVFTFEETPAAKVLVGVARGTTQYPDRAAIRDIDVFGFLHE